MPDQIRSLAVAVRRRNGTARKQVDEMDRAVECLAGSLSGGGANGGSLVGLTTWNCLDTWDAFRTFLAASQPRRGRVVEGNGTEWAGRMSLWQTECVSSWLRGKKTRSRRRRLTIRCSPRWFAGWWRCIVRSASCCSVQSREVKRGPTATTISWLWCQTIRRRSGRGAGPDTALFDISAPRGTFLCPRPPTSGDNSTSKRLFPPRWFARA